MVDVTRVSEVPVGLGPSAASAPEPHGAVLIVDDSLTVRMDLADAFQATGLRCLTCASLEEAVGPARGGRDPRRSVARR